MRVPVRMRVPAGGGHSKRTSVQMFIHKNIT